jgi:Erv1 / Alr family
MTKTYKNRKHLNKTNKSHTRKLRVFKKNDYASGDGMLVSVWGPSVWHALHTMSFNYPLKPTMEEKKHYRDFVLQLQYVLPCKYCRMNLKTNFKQLPLTMSKMRNRETFSRYMYDLHELVNRMLHKKSNLSYCDVRERYEHFRARCTEEKPKLFKFKKLDKNKTLKKKEKGCTEPLYGKKSKCIIKIVPQDAKEETFQMDKKCIKTRE